MTATLRICAATALCVSVVGCRTWGTAEGYTWTIKAPKSVDRGADLVFQVHAQTKDGQDAEGVSFYWMVDWVNLKGMQHKGKTFRDVDIRVKGNLGIAALRVYALDPNGNWAQVGIESIEVK